MPPTLIRVVCYTAQLHLDICRTLEFRCCAQIRPLKKESTWPQCVFSSCSRCTTATCCGAHVCNWPPPQVVWASLRAWARWAGRTLELLKLRRGSHFDTMHTADQDLCYGVFHPNTMWSMQQVPDQSFKKTCNSRNFNNRQSDKIRAIACNIEGTPTSKGCKKYQRNEANTKKYAAIMFPC